MNKEELSAFSSELEKLAVPGGALLRSGARWLSQNRAARGSAVSGALKSFAQGGAQRAALAGGAIGGVGNATASALRGESASDIAVAGGMGALGGAALGGVAGSAGRKALDTKLLNPKASRGDIVKSVVTAPGTALKNFGKRQIHGFTGAYKGQAADIGLGGVEAAKKKVHLENLRKADRLKGVASRSKAHRDISYKSMVANRDAIREGARRQAALDSGLTSLRGITQGMVSAPKETAGKLWRQNTGKGLKGKAMAVGLPTALMAPEIAKGDESSTGGKGLGQKLLNTGAMVGSSVAFGGVPIIPNVLGWTAGDQISNLPFKKNKKVQAKSAPAGVSRA